MNSEKSSFEREKRLVPYEESLKQAKQLWDRYQDEFRKNINKDVDGWGEPYTDYQKSIKHFLDQVPDEIRERYSAHGITRDSSLEQLASALNILANKSIEGSAGPLGGGAMFRAWTSGDFLVVSKEGQPLSKWKEMDGEQQKVFNKIGWEANIGSMIVDTRYYPIVDELKEMYPDVNIIKANEIPVYFASKKEFTP